ncbi:helix-turn-helix domain-containing protein [Sphingopyxis macrogoltabida]|uniref:HTH luxR-type domain-containing protein n=1 Tax=Sphingopyxis macrogoltabida TaxID=33050 RepID=A0A0N9UQP0_SPHMC|nr:helix-turn-helix transcriptional regulator [Sphingopyxis macrogoltabida]ALH82258.1 hypothetical protein AN936_18440 [Sphingopyxis macrogoltabida]
MQTDQDSKPNAGEFELLTAKQTAVLHLLAQGRTSKEIAGLLDTGESAVNRHIEIMRSRLGGITRLELARRYRNACPDAPSVLRVDSSQQKIDLVAPPPTDERPDRDDAEADLLFQDSLTMKIEAPWAGQEEPVVVPRVLDGANATLTRGAAITIMVTSILASLVLAITAAWAITEALGG